MGEHDVHSAAERALVPARLVRLRTQHASRAAKRHDNADEATAKIPCRLTAAQPLPGWCLFEWYRSPPPVLRVGGAERQQHQLTGR